MLWPWEKSRDSYLAVEVRRSRPYLDCTEILMLFAYIVLGLACTCFKLTTNVVLKTGQFAFITEFLPTLLLCDFDYIELGADPLLLRD